jgi:hypothetical protein
LLATNVFGLAEGGEFLAQMFNLAQMFFRSTMLKKALMPHFWQTHVVGSFFHSTSANFHFCINLLLHNSIFQLVFLIL